MLCIIGAGLGIFAWLLLVYVEVTLPVLVLFAVSWGVAAGIGAQAFCGVWAGELFATPYRASAQGVLFFAARISVGLLSYWFPTLLVTIGLAKLGLIMIALPGVACGCGRVLGAEDARQDARADRGRALRHIHRRQPGGARTRPGLTPLVTLSA